MACAKMLPEIVVFDLDYVLWPFHGKDLKPPLLRNKKNQLVDAKGFIIRPYDNTIKIIRYLKNELKIKIAIASRTRASDAAKLILDQFDLTRLISHTKIYGGTKKVHLREIAKESGIHLDKMLFFDDEIENIKDATNIGVATVWVPRNMGVTMDMWYQGLDLYRAVL